MSGHLKRRLQQIAVAMFLAECRDHDLTRLWFSILALNVLAPARGRDQFFAVSFRVSGFNRLSRKIE